MNKPQRTFQIEQVADRMNTARIVSTDGMLTITVEATGEAMHGGILRKSAKTIKLTGRKRRL